MGARAGVLLMGIAGACALPAVAAGQIDPNKSIGDTVNGVPNAVPHVNPPAVPKVPSLPSTGNSGSTQQSPAPGGSSGGGGGGSAGGGGGGGGSSSSPSGGGSGSSGSSKASAANAGGSGGGGSSSGSSKKGHKAGKGHVVGQKQSDVSKEHAAAAGGQDNGSEVRPATGIEGDSKLPFTGYALITIAALGLIGLGTGLVLRTGAGRLRFSRKRA